MTSTRFHRAAQDGMLEPLREATKRDCNTKDEDGMTPTLWAAYEGNLDALRLLVGRGGDPEKANYHFGQNALHLAAARGHMNCLSFLVGFGANLWALDHDMHTPMQVAGMQGHKDILEYLDKAAAKQEIINKKEVKVRKEKAAKDAERHRKKYEERMKKEHEKEEKRMKKVEKEMGGHKIETDTPIPTVPVGVRRARGDAPGPTFTQIVGAGTMNKKPIASVGVKKILDRKIRNGTYSRPIGGEQKPDSNSSRSVRSAAVQGTDAQIIYVNSYDAQNGGKRGRIADVFDTRGELHRSLSQPDYLDSSAILQEQSSIFDRPGFGSVAFRQRNHLAGTLSGLPRKDKEGEDSSIGSAGSLAKRNQAESSWEPASSDEENVDLNGISDKSSLQRFLTAYGVGEYTPQFLAQRIDLEALTMLSDQDLIILGIPMGPRRKILHAVEERKKAFEDPGPMLDSRL